MSQLRNLRFKIFGFSLSFSDFSFTAYNRSLRFTKEGGYFLVIVFALGITAINTGINLIYLLFAMCLSFIIVSGILSEYTLRGMRCHRELPYETYPDDFFPVTLTLSNNKKRWPSFSVWLEHGVEGEAEPQKFYFHKIMPHAKEKKTGMWRLEKRGINRFREMKLSTRFPFGFFEKSTPLGKTDTVIIYPRIHTVVPPSQGSTGGDQASLPQRGKGDEVFDFRKFSTGDDFKRIHWKTSAKLDEWMLKETQATLEPAVTIVFNNFIPEEKKKDPAMLDRFEQAVSYTASLVHSLAERGHQISLLTNHGDRESDGSGESLQRIYRFLALLEPAPETGQHVAEFSRAGESAGIVVVEV